MKAVIIEDEASNRKRLLKLLSELAPNIEISATLEGVEESVEYFRNNAAPDLIFMDIQLSDGVCFEIFDKVSINSPIIYTTAYDEYSIKAFANSGIAYLLKPLDSKDLIKALKLFEAQKASN